MTTQASEVWEKPRSVLIDGSATFTIVESSTIIRSPRQRTISASQRLRSSIAVSSAACSAAAVCVNSVISIASS